MTTLFLEAFGRLSGEPFINAVEEDLYSVFNARAELMRWGEPAPDEIPMLWAMEVAEITADTDPNRIGFAQVGLRVGPTEPDELPPSLRSLPSRRRMTAPSMELPESGGWYGYAPLPFRRKSTDPVMALPALAQCFHDSLSRFGDVQLTALQLSLIYPQMSEESCRNYLTSSLNWFNANLTEGADAVISFDQALLGDHDLSDLLARLTNWRDVPFRFSAIRNLPERCRIEQSESTIWPEATQTSPQGLLVSMPEWTPSAAGYVLATVIDLARDFSQDAETLTIRITRSQYPN